MLHPFKITILGSGTAVPRPDRAAPGYLVETGEEKNLVDPGPGSLRQLAEAGYHINDIDRILITHHHPDHNLDLMLFLFASRFPQMKRTRDLEMVVPENFPDMFENMGELYGDYISNEEYEIEMITAENKTFDFEEWYLDVNPTVHTRGSICFSFIDPDGRTILYTGDTQYNEALVDAAEGVDLVVVECSLPDDMEADGHMTPRWVAKFVDVARPQKTVLTHIYPPLDEVDPMLQIENHLDDQELLDRIEVGEDLTTYFA